MNNQDLVKHLDDILPFEGGGAFPVQYDITYNNHYYYVRYRHGLICIEKDEETDIFEQWLDQEHQSGDWTAPETTVYLYMISQELKSGGDFSNFSLPHKKEAPKHKMYVHGPLPRYLKLVCDKDHKHDIEKCYKGTISARERWLEENKN